MRLIPLRCLHESLEGHVKSQQREKQLGVKTILNFMIFMLNLTEEQGIKTKKYNKKLKFMTSIAYFSSIFYIFFNNYVITYIFFINFFYIFR